MILGSINKEPKLGKEYDSKKLSNKFYSRAVFYSVNNVQELLSKAGFSEFQMCRTLSSNPGALTSLEPVREDGYGEGGFFVINSIKP